MEKEQKPEKEPEKKKAKQDKELYWVLGVMAGLILIFLLAYSVFQDINKFEYNGLTFTKERLGDIPLFKYYYFTNPSTTGATVGEPRMINLYLRGDPRENSVPIEGRIEFPPRSNPMYISINQTDLIQCKYTTVALSSLTSFLVSNGFQVRGAVPDEQEADEKNVTYATCETHQNNAVIFIKSGNETKVVRNGNCYTVTASNCEILPPIEKFITQTIVEAKARSIA